MLRRARELGTAHTRWHDDIAEQQVDGCFILKNGEGLGTGSGCSVSASNMNFGSASLLSSALSATGQISVSCNASLPVTIALDNGATGTGPTNRLMTAGGNSIQYGIYKDSAHNQPWGNSVGTNTASGTGSKFRCVAGRSAAGGCSNLECHLSILNGGFQEWARECRPIESGLAMPRAAAKFAVREDWHLMVGKETERDAIGDGAVCVIMRSPRNRRASLP